jgi:hypothetical protein
MEPLRKGAVEEIRLNLNRGFLTSHLFDIISNVEDGTLLDITFLDRSTFKFRLLHPETAVNLHMQWKTVESPGRYLLSGETYDHQQLAQAISAAYAWADRISQELVLEAAEHRDNSLLEELRHKLNEMADNLTNPEMPFSEDEVDDWSGRFEAVLQRLSELERENETQKWKVENLARELHSLKSEGTKVPRRTWVKTVGNKILDVLSTASKAAVSAITEGAVKGLLG